MEYFIRGTAALNSATNHAISFFFNSATGRLYAKIGSTNYCIETCGAAPAPAVSPTTVVVGPEPATVVVGPEPVTVVVGPEPVTVVVTVSPSVNCTSCVQSGSYTSGAGCGGGACFQTWYTYTCAPGGCVGCNCPDVASGSCGGPACP